MHIPNNTLTSNLNSLYDGTILTGSLYAYNLPVKFSTSIAGLMNISQIIVSASLYSSIISGILSSPSCLWSLFNMLEIITYLPLNSIPYPEQLLTLFNSIGVLSIFPNPLSKLIHSENDSTPYLEAQRYGFTTSLFFSNAAQFLLNFVIFIAFIPFL